MAEECIFCKIVSGELPSYKVYEDEDVLAILDTTPVAKGHTLVLSKKHYVDVFDVDYQVLEKIAVVAKELSIKMKNDLGVDGVNWHNSSGVYAEQRVMHFHVHVVPRRKDDKICFDCVVLGRTDVTKEEFEEAASKIKLENKK